MKKFVLMVFFCLFSLQANAVSSTFVATDFSGKTFDLSKQKGKIVIINFWAKWCGDCRREMPVLDEIYKKYHEQGVEIIAASVDPKSQTDAVKSLAKRFSYPNSMLADVKQNDFPSPRRLPTNYIMYEGKVVQILEDNKLLLSDFEAVIKPLLKMNLTR